ncbi:septum formation initiator family protein [Nakamurella endophytica]|uniref:septum formation initiator family protein n=1 Tax=Nakamurella endophytica TaxID=1748367 RepID=UPI0016666268|nr:septum formation initiator family protein [Nakamurella endophytica]
MDGGSRPPAVPRRRSPLARQILVLGLVLSAVALVLAFPLRTYLSGRADLNDAVRTEQTLQQRLDDLALRKAALQDPDYIRAEARRRLQYVSPGDTVYVIAAPAPAPVSAGTPRPAAPARPWYSQMWTSLTEQPASADRP